MLDSPGVDLTAPEFCLGTSRALLVEFTRGGLPRGTTSELHRISRSGRTPILAHPEWYFGCTLQLVREWRALGVVIQNDASVRMGRGVPSNLAKSMLADGLIDILASVNLGDGRSLGTARVLGDEDPFPVPPLRDGLVGRIKRMLGR